MADSPPIIARGVLEKTPLAEFLARALDERIEGTLILQTKAGQKHAVLFLRGAPAKAKLEEQFVYLGDVLVDLDIIPRSLSVSTRKKAQAANKPHGQVLLEDGHLDESTLFVALRQQLHRQLLHLCDLPEDTVFGLYKANYLAKWGPVDQWRVKPLPLIWRALVDHLPRERRDMALERLGGHMLRIRFESPVSRYGMNQHELSVVNMLRAKPQTLTELEHCGIGAPEAIRKVACGLLISRQLEGAARLGPPVGHSEPPESPNSVAPPSMSAARRSISAPKPPRITGIEIPESAPLSASKSSSPSVSVQNEAFREAILVWDASPPVILYDVLGVPKEADTGAVQRAFFQLARQWHPDKLPEELADLKPIVTKAFARMGEAHHVLTDPTLRGEYDERLGKAPDDEQEQVALIIEASSSFQRAEVLLKKKDLAGALAEAQAAVTGDPSQPEYLALHDYLRVLNGEMDAREAIEAIGEAAKELPNNHRVLWYRAQLFKRENQSAAAVREFKKILALKPHDVEAKREIRVYEMRRRTDAKAAGGLFGRLRKKD